MNHKHVWLKAIREGDPYLYHLCKCGEMKQRGLITPFNMIPTMGGIVVLQKCPPHPIEMLEVRGTGTYCRNCNGLELHSAPPDNDPKKESAAEVKQLQNPEANK